MRKHIHFKRILVSRSYLVGFVAFTCLLMCSYMQAVTRSAGTEAAFIDAYTSSATSNDVISLTNNIVLTSELILAKNITINGNGYSISVPNPGLDDMGRFNDGASEFRVFTIDADMNVTMNNLTLKGRNLTLENGGAINILSTAELHLNNCIISNSRNSYSGGGGINNAGVVISTIR